MPLQSNIVIRQEGKDDELAIYTIHEKAFSRPFEAGLVERLRKGSSFIPELSLLALVGEIPVGHILFTKATIENKGTCIESLALAPVAVLPAYQQKGIGSQLILEGLNRATYLGFASVIVLGHEHYYPRFGFKPAVTWNIHAPFDVPSSFFMAKELYEGALTDVAGVVAYAKEFGDVPEPTDT